MRNLTKLAMGLASLATVTAAMPASAALVTDPNDARTWQMAGVGTFATLYFGLNTATTRQQVIDAGMLDDGLINTAGWLAGTLITSINTGIGGFSTDDGDGIGDPYAYTLGGTAAENANMIDNKWIQTSGVIGHTVFDLGFQANKAAIFNTIDHGPLPEEAIESTVYLSNDPFFNTYVQAVVERVYLEGFHPNLDILWDGFSYIVGTGTSATFRYASIIWGGPGALQADGDNEINGIMGLRADNTGCTIGVNCDSVPEPMTLSLLGAGLFGIGALRRRRA